MARAYADLTGQRFSRLTVLRFHDRTGGASHIIRWWCRCDCGTELPVQVTYLRGGTQKSCGCWRRDKHMTHGRSHTPEWNVWCGIIDRCYRQNSTVYDNYGGRGIAVCDLWRESFSNFFADMGTMPSPKHSIDRIDNEGHYEPGNCRWATSSEQMSNQRTRRTSASGVKGITWIERDQVWNVRMPGDPARTRIGRFKDLQLAIQALELAQAVIR